MSTTSRYLCISDVLKIFEDAACDEPKQKRLKRMNLISFPKQFFFDADKNEYLLQVPGEIREDSAFAHYYFFTHAYLFEIHRVGHFSNKYSFISFPKDFEDRRKLVQERFTSAQILSGECMGWFEGLKWEELTDEQKALCYPVFVEDDAKPPLM